MITSRTTILLYERKKCSCSRWAKIRWVYYDKIRRYFPFRGNPTLALIISTTFAFVNKQPSPMSLYFRRLRRDTGRKAIGQTEGAPHTRPHVTPYRGYPRFPSSRSSSRSAAQPHQEKLLLTVSLRYALRFSSTRNHRIQALSKTASKSLSWYSSSFPIH